MVNNGDHTLDSTIGLTILIFSTLIGSADSDISWIEDCDLNELVGLDSFKDKSFIPLGNNSY